MRPLRIFTWHVHGTYLYYLSQVPHEFLLPVKEGRPEGYGGRAGHLPWPENVREVPAEQARDMEFDVVLYQSRRNYLIDQHEVLSPQQQKLPRIYLEHDPPLEHPTETRHLVDDPDVLLVHVTPFNALMWDSGRTPARVIEHGVLVPDDVQYTGEIARGISVVNNIASRGRRLGADVFAAAQAQVPIDIAGMGSDGFEGGLGDVPHHLLLPCESRYRFFFNPIRYTSLGLSVCEAMMLGMPVVALATTEMATVIQNGVSGYADTSIERLAPRMRELLDDTQMAKALGEGARRIARERFGIERFVRDWCDAFADVTASPRGSGSVAGTGVIA